MTYRTKAFELFMTSSTFLIPPEILPPLARRRRSQSFDDRAEAAKEAKQRIFDLGFDEIIENFCRQQKKQ